MKRIAVFLSGRGSNFRAIHKEVERGTIDGAVVTVVSDNPDAKGLQYAEEKGIEHRVFVRKDGETRAEYFQDIMEYLESLSIDLIVLAGFMIVLSENIIRRYQNRIINIHPALLPSFRGVEAQRRAYEYGVRYSGCTVHFIDEGVDTGPIIDQRVVPVRGDDDAHSLAERILEQEHILFPEVVRLFCDDRLVVNGRKVFIRQEKKNRGGKGNAESLSRN
jgi:phosphoribosylglycinamide formyltransferase-1